MKPTLTYPLRDKQLIFDYVWHHFVVEKNPRAVQGYSCLYCTPTGGCAVGCLLPDDLRNQIGNASFAIAAVWKEPGIEKPLAPDHGDVGPFRAMLKETFDPSVKELLIGLQTAHDLDAHGKDHPDDLSAFHARLRGVAKKHKLTVPVPQ